MKVTRRVTLKSFAALAATAWCPSVRVVAATLTAGITRQQIVPAEHPRTGVWS